jgi:LPS-assembly protein
VLCCGSRTYRSQVPADFPLSDKRKSGLLPPTFNVGSVSGFEVRQPYYS